MILIGLPMYNEGEAIVKQLEETKKVMEKNKFKYKVLIVNDGSTDGCRENVEKLKKKMPLQVFDHEVNMGYGKTLADLFVEASKMLKPNDFFITMDADNTMVQSQIIDMIPLASKDADVVIASRYASGSKQEGLAFYRKFLSSGMKVMIQILFPLRGVKDYSCGYRTYRARLVLDAVKKYGNKLVECDGFPALAEVLIKMSRLRKLKVREIPLILRYDLKETASKLKLVKTVKEYLKMMFVLRFLR